MYRSFRGLAAVISGLLAMGLVAHPTAVSAAGAGKADRPKKVRVVAVGDIACAPGSEVVHNKCQHAATATLAERLRPRRVLALGDLQYRSGTLEEFQASYHPTWGRLRGKTHPVPGNHEYQTPGAAGYYEYFGSRQPGAPGWYARRYGSWRVYALNSNCDQVSCKRQLRWFKARLAKHRARCTLVAMHHPRYSSVTDFDVHPGVVRLTRVAYRRGVDLVLSGHEHNYERFAPMNAGGRLARDGFVQFVVGTGGAWHRSSGQPTTGSQYQDDQNFGVLKLVLRPRGYRHAFVTISGEKVDRGGRRCT